MTIDIAQLMLDPMGNGAADQFGSEPDKRRPLLLDTITGGQRQASRSRLLQMPSEILADIVHFLSDSKSTVANLALVNSDCRQLARSSQFADVTFDYSQRSRGLFAHMALQAVSNSTGPSIATCVRKVTFEVDTAHLRAANHELFETFGGRGVRWRENRETVQREATEKYMVLRGLSAYAISIMPNLEALIWVDYFPLDRVIFGQFTHSKAKHVKLNRGIMNEPPWPLEPPLTPATWPIRSLDLQFTLGTDYLSLAHRDRGSLNVTDQISQFFTSLFRLCSPTLESLRWSFMQTYVISLGNHVMSFPHLRELHLDSVQLGSLELSSFFSCPLRSLRLQPGDMVNPALHHIHHRSLRDLKAFALPKLPTESEQCEEIVHFITQHSHLEKLLIHELCGNNDAQLDRHIIPALASHSFSNLRSLSLAWGGGKFGDSDYPHDVHIPKQALLTIGNLVSLEQLCLCAGLITGYQQCQWAVDHAELVSCLGKLKRLEKLALVQDTYPIPGGVMDSEVYYRAFVVTPAEIQDAELRPELDPEESDEDDEMEMDDDSYESIIEMRQWNRAHRNRMLHHAEKYAAVLPELEWMLCGKLPIGFEQDPENPAAPRRAVPLSLEMDSCNTFLELTFGCGITQA
ncbi:hypothetical protein CEP54_012121 [Fusarium duplospermum]|uniref:F-box domain-containing protein n=1 Tax=Fusarium duplospermum TaxID=1325734 RepID=A0A428PAI6_9HYPO|nr:hypothetical protein CEP54_012121 [Fusarium duplospermum]